MNFTNVSSVVEDTWLNTGSFVIVTIIDIAGFFFNAIVALILVRNRPLRTPFHLIITALMVSNSFFCISDYADSLTFFNPNTFSVGYYSCTFFLYCGWILVDVPIVTHVLISLNRVWAIYFPISYRNYTKRTAFAMLLTGVLFNHVFLLPGFVMDALYYRSDNVAVRDSNHCHLNSEKLRSWIMVVQIVCYCLPIVFMVASTIIILKKSRLNPQRQSNGLRMLIVLTVSVVICWVPYTVYYTVGLFRPELSDYAFPLEYLLATLYSLQGVLDPILVVCTMPDIRKRLLKCCITAV